MKSVQFPVTDLVAVPDLHPLDVAVLSAEDVYRLVERHTCPGNKTKRVTI